MIFNIQLVCPNGSKMLIRSRQVDPKMVILAVMLAHLGALGCHLGSELLQLGLQDASSCKGSNLKQRLRILAADPSRLQARI